MGNVFDKWDKTIDTEGLAKDVAEAAENGGNYKEVPHGNYEVKVEQMELKESKAGDPMVSIWFKIVEDGEFKGSMIFFNQVITQGFQVHIVNEMLRDLVQEMEDAPEIEFRKYSQYADLIMDIFEAIDDNFEYELEYKANPKNKKFNTYKIKEVFVLD